MAYNAGEVGPKWHTSSDPAQLGTIPQSMRSQMNGAREAKLSRKIYPEGSLWTHDPSAGVPQKDLQELLCRHSALRKLKSKAVGARSLSVR